MSVEGLVHTRHDTAVTRLVPPVGVTITIPGVTSYITTGIRVTLRKSTDSSVIQVLLASSGFQTSLASQLYWGIRIFGPGSPTGSDVNMGVFWFNTANEHMCMGSVKELTGYAAGTYVIEMLMKLANAGTVQQIDYNDTIQFLVIESEQ